MKIKRVYISGPMTGIDDFNRRAFFAAELRLYRQAEHEGWIANVENPGKEAHWNIVEGKSYGSCMRSCIERLVDCDAILMLPGWEHSRGACVEREIAEICGMEVLEYADE